METFDEKIKSVKYWTGSLILSCLLVLACVNPSKNDFLNMYRYKIELIFAILKVLRLSLLFTMVLGSIKYLISKIRKKPYKLFVREIIFLLVIVLLLSAALAVLHHAIRGVIFHDKWNELLGVNFLIFTVKMIASIGILFTILIICHNAYCKKKGNPNIDFKQIIKGMLLVTIVWCIYTGLIIMDSFLIGVVINVVF